MVVADITTEKHPSVRATDSQVVRLAWFLASVTGSALSIRQVREVSQAPGALPGGDTLSQKRFQNWPRCRNDQCYQRSFRAPAPSGLHSNLPAEPHQSRGHGHHE